MASIALEEKINKIRQQNEEIRRRYEEVEEDKKNAAKINALVQMVPSTDWPERKEPPEFSNPPRPKQKVPKEKHEYISQTHNTDPKKGDGPPPDPKYNFLADSEREEGSVEHTRENVGGRTHNKAMRGSYKKRGSGRDGMQKDNRVHKGNYREDHQPGYEAWRAERNRIDEDRISRQRTAEGNWRREWDNDKMHVGDDVNKPSNRATFGEYAKKDHKDFERRYYGNGGDYSNHNRGSQRPYRGASKHYHSSYENRSHNTYDQHKHNTPMSTKTPLVPVIPPDERTVVATDKSIKVTVNQQNASKGPVMSVKVNLPSIAGTGRVGPRQRTRVTYSQSDAEGVPEAETFSRQKSFDDKSKSSYFSNQKNPNIKRSHSQRTKKNETGSKSPYLQRKKDEINTNAPKYHDNEITSEYPSKSYSASKSYRATRSTRLSGSDNSDTPNLVQEGDDHVANDKSEELPSEQEESNVVQSKERKEDCDPLDVVMYDNIEENNKPVIDDVASSPNSMGIDEFTKDEELMEQLDVNSTDELIEQLDVNSTEELMEQLDVNSTEELMEQLDVNSTEELMERHDVNFTEELMEQRNISSTEEFMEQLSVNSTEELMEQHNVNFTEELMEQHDVNSTEELMEQHDDISTEEMPDVNSGEVSGNLSETSVLNKLNAKDEDTVENVMQNDSKLVENPVSDLVELSEDKCDLSSSATNEHYRALMSTPMDTQTENVVLNENANEKSESNNTLSSSNETQPSILPQEQEKVLPISNCSSNNDAAVVEEKETKAERTDTACLSAKDETHSVINSEEQTELMEISEEINEQNHANMDDSKLSMDDIQGSVTVNDLMGSGKTKSNDKVESQDEMLGNSKAEKEKPVDN